MIFPNLALWGAPKPDDPVGRINRALNDRTHRLIAGLSTESEFESVNGALVVAQGHGKYLRLRHVVGASAEIPESIREGCLGFTQGENTDFGHLKQLLCDLASIQAAVFEKLKCQAGKYVDRVLAVAVCDPGYWSSDFDGRMVYAPMCDATTLAELCGVSVIDSMPARDLAVDGSGRGLEALPYWLMFADRNRRVARQSRALVTVNEKGRYVDLPASDGLDSDVPKIKLFETIGFRFLDALTLKYFPVDDQQTYMDQLYADGLHTPELRTRWEASVKKCIGSHERLALQTDDIGAFDPAEISASLVEQADIYLKENSDLFSNVVRTGICWVLDLLCREVVSKQPDSAEKLDELVVSVSPQYEACVVNRLDQILEGVSVNSIRKYGVETDQLASVVAAVLGLFHIDQMPANVPWITGAKSQRILGNLTPGRPSSWRQLLRAMADFHPAPMKLRDAV